MGWAGKQAHTHSCDEGPRRPAGRATKATNILHPYYVTFVYIVLYYQSYDSHFTANIELIFIWNLRH